MVFSSTRALRRQSIDDRLAAVLPLESFDR
jgi:hypothetical protein